MASKGRYTAGWPPVPGQTATTLARRRSFSRARFRESARLRCAGGVDRFRARNREPAAIFFNDRASQVSQLPSQRSSTSADEFVRKRLVNVRGTKETPLFFPFFLVLHLHQENVWRELKRIEEGRGRSVVWFGSSEDLEDCVAMGPSLDVSDASAIAVSPRIEANQRYDT